MLVQNLTACNEYAYSFDVGHVGDVWAVSVTASKGDIVT